MKNHHISEIEKPSFATIIHPNQLKQIKGGLGPEIDPDGTPRKPV